MSHTHSKHSNKPRQNMKSRSYNNDTYKTVEPDRLPSRAWICGRYLPLALCNTIKKLVKRGARS